MAAFEPFLPAVKAGATGFSQVIVLSSTSQTIQVPASVSNGETALLITGVNNNTAASVSAYVRISVEASTSIVATATDTPIFITTSNPTVRLFASPNMTGTYNVAAVCTVAPSTSASIFITPGQGGV
jgi:hypothetical protein